MNWAELSFELGRVVLVRDFIGPSGLVRVVFGPSCPAPQQHTDDLHVNSTGKFISGDDYWNFFLLISLKTEFNHLKPWHKCLGREQENKIKLNIQIQVLSMYFPRPQCYIMETIRAHMFRPI